MRRFHPTAFALAAAFAAAVAVLTACGGADAPGPEGDDPPPDVASSAPTEESARVAADPVAADAPAASPGASESPATVKQHLADPRLNSDSPFEGPGHGGTIGLPVRPGSAIGYRRSAHRNLLAGPAGATQRAAAADLDFLRDRAVTGGAWPSAAGPTTFDETTTALGLLAFLSVGDTHQAGPRRQVVRDAGRTLRFLLGEAGAVGTAALKAAQDGWARRHAGASGTVCARDTSEPSADASAAPLAFTHAHGPAVVGLAEIYGLTQSVIFKDDAQVGVLRVETDVARTLRRGLRVASEEEIQDAAWALLALHVGNLVELETDRDVLRNLARAVLASPAPPDAAPRTRACHAALRTLALALSRDPPPTRSAVSREFAALVAACDAAPDDVSRPGPLLFFASLAAAQAGDDELRLWTKWYVRPLADLPATADPDPARIPDAAWRALCLTSFLHLPRAPRSNE